VLCADPYVADPKLVSQDEVLRDADLLVIGAPHRRYKGLDVGERPVVDVWGIVAGRITL
jgi:UDP-N-acetyl-D-mannosaminuronic acid dehydrogenase